MLRKNSMLKARSLILSFKACMCVFCTGCSIQPLYDNSLEYSSGSSISVDMIPNRNGQKLYGFLQDYVRDINIADKSYRLNVQLIEQSQPYALADDGNNQRLKITYIANITLKDYFGNVVFQGPVKTSSSKNILSAQGDVLLNIYEANADIPLKDLALRIIEQIKVAIKYESRI